MNSHSSLHVDNPIQALPVSATTTVLEGQSRRCSPAANEIHRMALCKFVTLFWRYVTGSEARIVDNSFQQFRIDSLMTQSFYLLWTFIFENLQTFYMHKQVYYTLHES